LVGLSVIAVWKQFYGYGGFMESFLKVIILKQNLNPFQIIFSKFDMTKNYWFNWRNWKWKTTIANHFRS
jgi:hypothetical protein